ncbi:hypothetical protein [Cupriavidus sp. amp6]|uniref:hypothetical protein n=1 Tax=Cupriavidus sp. amp6 TaxID=388051 RepID=UPI000410D903|nr:hypothetical protein [Cupriavidus sp. amp6]
MIWNANLVPWRSVGAVALMGVLAVVLFAAGWTANGWRKDAEFERLKVASAQVDLAEANRALEDLSTAGRKIREAADDYAGIQTTLSGKLDAIRKDLKNAKPLPVGCRPDDVRMRKLSDAVDAAKQAAAAR